MDWLFYYADPTIDWPYAMVTLVVRFIGVFVVMALVQVSMQVASVVVKKVEGQRDKAKATAAAKRHTPPTSLDVSGMADEEGAVDGATVAAIGLALALEAQQKAAAGRRLASAGSSQGPSGWAMAGRVRSMR